jgi:hypothetical protein
MANLKGKLVQVNDVLVLEEANNMFTILKSGLEADKGVTLSLKQSYLSKFEVADELRKRVKDRDKREILDDGKTMKDILDSKATLNNQTLYKNLEFVLNNFKNEDYDPPLMGAWKSAGGQNVYQTPNRIDTDPRRTGNLIIPGPADVMQMAEVRKWLINNSVLYGFVMYSDIGLYYLGVDRIKNEVKKAADKNAKLRNILTTFLKPGAVLDGLTLTGQKVIENNLPAPSSGTAMFPDPGNLESIPRSEAERALKLPDGRVLDFVVVDGKIVEKNLAFAFVAMKKAAVAAGMSDKRIAVFSGYRPAFGKNASVKSNKGTHYNATSQEALRRDRRFWSGRGRFSGNDEQFVFNAPSDCFTEKTAKPGTSRHGFGTAIDIAIGKRRNNSLAEKEYIWLVKNSWKFGFIRTVDSEEWHFEYIPSDAIRGPYAGLAGTDAHKFYSDLGLSAGQFAYTANSTAGTAPSPTKQSTPTTTKTSVVIGDSISVLVDQIYPKINGISKPVLLNKSGETASWLLGQLRQITTPYNNVTSLVLSIGSNNAWNLTSTDTLLAEQIKRVFPNATRYILNGNYGWGGLKVGKEDWPSKINTYINFYRGKGFNVVGTATEVPEHPKNGDKLLNSFKPQLSKL